MKVGLSSQDDLYGELAEFASHPLWRNIFQALDQHTEDLKTFAANSIIADYAYNKGLYHGALKAVGFLRQQLEQYKG